MSFQQQFFNIENYLQKTFIKTIFGIMYICSSDDILILIFDNTITYCHDL